MLNQKQIEMLVEAKRQFGDIMPVVNKNTKRLWKSWSKSFNDAGFWFNTPDRSTHFFPVKDVTNKQSSK